MRTADSIKFDLKGLWAIGWRMLLLAPFVAIFGSLFLFVILASSILPIFYAVSCIISGDYFQGLGSIVFWYLWLRCGGPLRKLAEEGWKYGSL